MKLSTTAPRILLDPLIPEARRRQRRRQVAIVLALLGAGAIALLVLALNGRGGSSAAVAQRRGSQAPLYAILSSNHGTPIRKPDGSYTTLPPRATIARLDPRTLRLEPGRLAVGRFSGGRAVSPDTTHVALFDHGTLRLVDLERFRIERTIRLGDDPGTMIRDVAWVGPNRLFAIVQRQSLPYFRNVLSRRLLLIDASNGRVLRRWSLTNKLALAQLATAGGRYVFLLQDSSLKGSSIRLQVATPAGLRSVTVGVGKSHGVLRPTTLSVTPDGRRAFLLTPGSPITAVDLRSLRVTRHPLSVTKASRPAGLAYGLGVAADNRTLLVGGGIATGSTLRAGGVYALDTRAWSARLLDPAATWAIYAQGVVVTSGPAAAITSRHDAGFGVSAYRLDGTKLYHVLGHRSVYVVSVTGGRVLAFRPLVRGLSNRQQWIAFDLATGKHIVTVARTGNMTILG
jgi:hypothetical protein